MSKKSSSTALFIIVAFTVIGGVTFGFNTITSASTHPISVTPVIASNSGMYTLAQVATHNTRTDCWTVVDGGVYDVTSWISHHPGGQQAIVGMCGIDASEVFDDQHGGERRPVSELASFAIGTLIQ